MKSSRRLGTLAAATLLFPLSCSGPGDGPRDIGTRAVVIGIDGADWKLIDELAAGGRMPHLASLRQRGVSGPIETLNDIALSPVIWTSIATGKTAVKHGIAWFMVDQPDGTRVPVRSYNRKVRALWNILSEHHRKPVVVGWWATYPAEDVKDGIVVSDALGFHGFGATASGGDDAKKTHPAPLYRDVFPLVPPEQQLSADFVSRFIHITPEDYRNEMFDPSRYPQRDPTNPIHLFQEYAVTAQGYTAITRRLLAHEPYDLAMVYFEQVDSLSHLFMKYAAPALPWVAPVAAARYGDLVREWYVYQDELLGQLLAEIDLDRTAIFVLSDHGFKSGDRRIRSEETVDVKRAHLDHEARGIFIAAGPHIRRDAKLDGASVLDITPTVLHYLGLAVGKDMDGKVLEGVFEPEFTAEHAISYVATYEDAVAPDGEIAGTAPEPGESEPTSAAEQAAQEEALRSLGYLAGGSASPAGSAGSGGAAVGGEARAAGESSPEMHNNMGRILLRNGESAKAQREFERALELDPNGADALLNLAAVHRAAGRTGEAERLVKRALGVDPNSIAALSDLAGMQRDAGNLDEAIRLFAEAVAIDGSLPFVHLGYGDCLQRAGRFKEAEREFFAVLQQEPDSFQARYNLGVTYANQGRLADAEAQYLAAVKLHPDAPENGEAYNNLGAMALAAGKADGAEVWFEKAVKAQPGNLESNYNLAMSYLDKNRVPEAIKLLETAAAASPNHELVSERLGMAYLVSGRGEDAYRSFLLVRRLYPKNWLAPLGLAALHANAGQPDEAKRQLDDALRLGGKPARVRAADFPVLAVLLDAAATPK